MIKRRVFERSSILLSSLLALAAVGCASQTPTPRDARAAGEWTFRLPQTRSPYADLAIAHGGGDPGALAMVDAALDTTPAATPAAKPRPVAKRTVVAAEPAVAAKQAPQPVAASVMATPVQTQQLALNTPPTNKSDEQRYLQRESQSQKQRDFRGGDAIVISASALVIILLVVILILLLT